MRKKIVFSFVIVNMISMLISSVAFANPSGPYNVFLPMVSGRGSTPGKPVPIVSSDVHHDTSAPLGALAAAMAKNNSKPSVVYPARPVNAIPNNADQVDTAQQLGPAAPINVAMGLSFPGTGKSDYGFFPVAAPPDTTLAVGDTQVVQWVNSDFTVFNKATGALIFGPVDANTLWNGFGGGCQTNNDGDPMIQWDQLNHRWIFAQFSVSTTPYLYCFAVSVTSDATGAYYRYSYATPGFPDYAKMGIWPDAYYVSFNMFSSGTGSFTGANLCAYNGAAMRIGAAAASVCFLPGITVFSVLPADLDGATPPASGTPNYMLMMKSVNSLTLFKFHVNFTTPASSTLTNVAIPVTAFTEACSGLTCIKQPGTANLLDSLADRLMYRLSYRKYSTYDALVVTHSVTSSWGTSGIRWYEIRNPGITTPVVYQQGTYAPDARYRWMGSIAQDNVGNIAVGYSVSAPNLYPSIRFTGRLIGDPLNTLRAENTLFGGAGSQSTNSLHRWGDYSTMDVDPVDGCTFWYTNEYLKADGSFNWSTNISSFKFPNCS